MIARESTVVFVAIMFIIAAGTLAIIVGAVAMGASIIGANIPVDPAALMMIGGAVCLGGSRIGRAVYGRHE